MKRLLIPLILIGLAFGMMQINNQVLKLQDQSVYRSNLVQVIQRIEPSVVYIEAQDEGGRRLWSGSGVIISEDGLILTAAHVVNGAGQFKIILPDGREFLSYRSFCRYDITDVGFIQLDDAEGLPVSYLGRSISLKKGLDVFVIGCPFGYELRFTVTKGIVSGLDRDCDGFFGEKLILQVDAQSWPGNSGGPVYNMQGQIIGILVGGYYGVDGIGLCIPVDVIQGILNIYQAEQEMK